MKATVTYKTGNSIMTMTVDEVMKIEKVFVTSGGTTYEETRVYTSDWHWRSWISKGIINIFLEA